MKHLTIIIAFCFVLFSYSTSSAYINNASLGHYSTFIPSENEKIKITSIERIKEDDPNMSYLVKFRICFSEEITDPVAFWWDVNSSPDDKPSEDGITILKENEKQYLFSINMRTVENKAIFLFVGYDDNEDACYYVEQIIILHEDNIWRNISTRDVYILHHHK